MDNKSLIVFNLYIDDFCLQTLLTLIHLLESLSNLCDWQSQCSGINNYLLGVSPHDMIASVTAQQGCAENPNLCIPMWLRVQQELHQATM